MKANSDAFFTKGSTHTVCQDYARAGAVVVDRAWNNDELIPGSPFAIVCDGCSGSQDTDIGARILASVAAYLLENGYVREHFFTPYVRQSVLGRAHRAVMAMGGITAMGGFSSWLDATMLVARFDGVATRVSIIGDGAVLVRMRNGEVALHVFEHPHNAPFYLSYMQDPARHDAYVSKYGMNTTHRKLVRSVDGVWSQDFESTISGWDACPEICALSSGCDLVMLLSDGAASFLKVVDTGTSRYQEAVPIVEVVDELLKIKSFAGPFLQRRCQVFLDKFCKAKGWQHADDFSAAAIYMPEL